MQSVRPAVQSAPSPPSPRSPGQSIRAGRSLCLSAGWTAGISSGGGGCRMVCKEGHGLLYGWCWYWYWYRIRVDWVSEDEMRWCRESLDALQEYNIRSWLLGLDVSGSGLVRVIVFVTHMFILVCDILPSKDWLLSCRLESEVNCLIRRRFNYIRKLLYTCIYTRGRVQGQEAWWEVDSLLRISTLTSESWWDRYDNHLHFAFKTMLLFLSAASIVLSSSWQWNLCNNRAWESPTDSYSKKKTQQMYLPRSIDRASFFPRRWPGFVKENRHAHTGMRGRPFGTGPGGGARGISVESGLLRDKGAYRLIVVVHT